MDFFAARKVIELVVHGVIMAAITVFCVGEGGIAGRSTAEAGALALFAVTMTFLHQRFDLWAWGAPGDGGGPPIPPSAQALAEKECAAASASALDDGRPRVVVVTGGSRGIGAAVCKMLGKQGYRVAVNYRANEDMANAVVKEIESAGGVAVAVKADVSRPVDVAILFDEAEKKLGARVTHLVNNAAVIGPRDEGGTLLGSDANGLRAAIQTCLATNLFGVLTCCRVAAERMSVKRGGRGGAIVNVSSGSALIGSPMPYGVSKGALNSLQAGLVRELADHGVRINSVSPGMTKTDMLPPSVLAGGVGAIPMGRAAEPHEIASVVCFLLSGAASYCSGANVRVAGGKPMGGLQ